MIDVEHTVGIISDTHGLLRPAALAALQGSSVIVHAGDIGGPEVLNHLADMAPLVAVEGNMDGGDWARSLPRNDIVEIGEVTLYVLHDLGELDLDPRAAGISAVISGHSHRPKIKRENGVLFLNPGSAGPRRFNLPITLARIRLTGLELDPEIIYLDG